MCVWGSLHPPSSPVPSRLSGIKRFDQPTFAVESYLERQGQDFAGRYDAKCVRACGQTTGCLPAFSSLLGRVGVTRVRGLRVSGPRVWRWGVRRV